MNESQMKKRTKEFAKEIIRLCRKLLIDQDIKEKKMNQQSKIQNAEIRIPQYEERRNIHERKNHDS